VRLVDVCYINTSMLGTIVCLGKVGAAALKGRPGRLARPAGDDRDPVGQWFVASLAQPGGEITGLTPNAQSDTRKAWRC
jgi:hypothetical protein